MPPRTVPPQELPSVHATDVVPPLVPSAGARHASWLELFFDLVAVAGVAQLARLLQGGPDAHDVAVYAVLFAAFWTAWISNTLYGDVAAEKTRTRTLLLGMFGLTVMAAAVHGVQEGSTPGRSPSPTSSPGSSPTGSGSSGTSGWRAGPPPV